jgi:hypothetical protein
MVPFETVQLYNGDGATDGTLKVTNPPLHHEVGKADSTPGVLGFPNMTIVLAGLVPGHDTELAVTDKLPVLKLLATLNKMVALPCPLAIVVPAGLVQVKVAPA